MNWSEFAAVVSAFIAALAALISLWQAYEFRKQVSDDRRHTKLQALMAISPIYADKFIDAAKTLQGAFPDFGETEKITEANWRRLKEDLELNAAYGVMLYHWDRIAIAYQSDIIDRVATRTTLSRAFLFFGHYFEDHLTSGPDGGMSKRLGSLLSEWQKP